MTNQTIHHTQTTLAKLLGSFPNNSINQQTVSKLPNGNRESSTSKLKLILTYFVVPILAALFIGVLAVHTKLNILYAFMTLFVVYILLVYTFPIPLDSVINEWKLSYNTICFVNDKNLSKLYVPFYVVFQKRYEQELTIADIDNVTLSIQSNGYHMDKGFALNAWSSYMNPDLQTMYVFDMKLTNGKIVKLSSKNTALVLSTISAVVNANKIITIMK